MNKEYSRGKSLKLYKRNIIRRENPGIDISRCCRIFVVLMSTLFSENLWYLQYMGFARSVQSEIAYVKYNKSYELLYGILNYHFLGWLVKKNKAIEYWNWPDDKSCLARRGRLTHPENLRKLVNCYSRVGLLSISVTFCILRKHFSSPPQNCEGGKRCEPVWEAKVVCSVSKGCQWT